MIRNLHFYKWFVAVVVLICSTITMSAQIKVTSVSQLKAGSVIKIYPKDSDGTSHYGESKSALACSGDGQSLTSYEKAGSGDEWTLEDAGDGFCYLKNNNGCYWAYQGRSSSESLQCTINKSSAVKISLTWDSKYSGVCFWNGKDGSGLNNLFEYNNRYNWWSDPNNYSSDANTCFDIAILCDGNGGEVIKPDENTMVKVTSVSQLKAGCVIKIYPNGHYGESKHALACSDDQRYLTSYDVAESGDKWILEDAGDGYFYIKNNYGYYWPYKGSSSIESLTCTMDKSSAAKISLTWDTKYRGVCFWNEKNGRGLNNLNRYGEYSWWSNPDNYSTDANTTFDVALLKEDGGSDFVQVAAVINGIKYRLDAKQKTAKVQRNDYSGDIVIPETVTYDNISYKVTALEVRCFEFCSSLTSISLPASLISLGKDCFNDCDKLTNISLPYGLTSIGNGCFGGCSSLTSISLPSGITSLGESCFSSCSSLKSISLPSSLISLGEYCFNNCSSLTSVSLPYGLTSIGNGCFGGCSSLTSISLPSGITSLGESCFSGCSSLTSISLPSSITTIGEDCFKGCI